MTSHPTFNALNLMQWWNGTALSHGTLKWRICGLWVKNFECIDELENSARNRIGRIVWGDNLPAPEALSTPQVGAEEGYFLFLSLSEWRVCRSTAWEILGECSRRALSIQSPWCGSRDILPHGTAAPAPPRPWPLRIAGAIASAIDGRRWRPPPGCPVWEVCELPALASEQRV